MIGPDNFRPPERALDRPVRLVISDIFKSLGASSGSCIAGRLESGMIQSGDKLLLLPLNEVITAKSNHVLKVNYEILCLTFSTIFQAIVMNENPVGSCFAGDQVVLTVSGSDLNGVGLGSVLCDPNQPIKVTSRIQARIVIFNIDIPITKGYPVSSFLHFSKIAMF